MVHYLPGGYSGNSGLVASGGSSSGWSDSFWAARRIGAGQSNPKGEVTASRCGT